MARAPYSFATAPLQDPIVRDLYLTDAWRNWFLELSNRFLVRWDDLRFPAQGINPPGAGSDPGRDATTGLLSFSGLNDNVIVGVAQLPHSWLPGSTIRPHVHLRFPNGVAAANTRWRFEYDIANVGEYFTNVSGTYTTLTTITAANPQNVNCHVIAGFGDLTMAGFRESCIVLWKVSRLAGTDVLDDEANDVLLLEFDIHYQVHKEGTVPEIPE